MNNLHEAVDITKHPAYIRQLDKQYKNIDNIQEEIIKAGGGFRSREEVLKMSVEELLFNCNTNNIEVKLQYKRKT